MLRGKEAAEERTERFLRFKLAGILPETDWMYLDQASQNLFQIHLDPNGLMFPVELQRLTDQEYDVFACMLGFFPDWSPYEHLMAAFTHNTVERCRKKINLASDDGEMDLALRPLVNVVCRLRVKAIPFHIDITTVHKLGYMLMDRRTVIHRRS